MDNSKIIVEDVNVPLAVMNGQSDRISARVGKNQTALSVNLT